MADCNYERECVCENGYISRNLRTSVTSPSIRLLPAGHCYWRKSSRQKYILEATLAGRTVKSMAEVLGVDDQAVFAARTALITKMG